MSGIMTLYHGSERIIREPVFGGGRESDDFGRGFYCTENEELARERAVSALKDGFCSRYSLDTEKLNTLRLNSEEYSILNWIAVLVQHRLFSVKTPGARRAKCYFTDNFSINVSAYDLIIGYRADDSYFDFAESFLNNGISVSQLARAMRLGKPGEQAVLKSKFAFSRLRFEDAELVKKKQYFEKRQARSDEANKIYQQIQDQEDDELYIQDIIRGGITNDDPRIPRNLS